MSSTFYKMDQNIFLIFTINTKQDFRYSKIFELLKDKYKSVSSFNIAKKKNHSFIKPI